MTTPLDKREHARRLASRFAVGFAHLLWWKAIVELIAAAVRAVAEPSATPAVLVDVAAVGRAALAFAGAWIALRAVPYARALGVGHFATGAVGLMGVALVAALLPRFDLVPDGIDEGIWDGAFQWIGATAFLAAACMALFVGRAFAKRESAPLVARHLVRGIIPLVAALPVAFQAVDPALVGTPWLGPGIALALPWALVYAQVMRWDIALWVTLGILSVGGAAIFGRAEIGLTLSAVAMAAVSLMAAVSAGGALTELPGLLGSRNPEEVSRTFLRRLYDGTLGGEGARVGDLVPDSNAAGGAQNAPRSEESEASESLALAYRELGIGPEKLPAREDLVVPEVVAPLVPISRIEKRPEAPGPSSAELPVATAVAAVVVLPGAWSAMRAGLRYLFAGVVARVLLVAFGYLLSASPFADMPSILTLFDVTIAASAVAFAIGSWRLGAIPVGAHDRDGLRRLAGLAAGASTLVVLADLALVVTRLEAPGERGLVMGVDAALGAVATGLVLLTLGRLAASFALDKLTQRTRSALMLLAGLTTAGVGLAIVKQLPSSDLQWLAFPLGVVAIAVGLGLFVSLLWILRDTSDALATRRPTGNRE
jgi:hypothetical protein